MKVKEAMNREVSLIHTNASVQEAAEIMKARDVGTLPVVLDGEAVGLITDRDITVRVVAKGMDPQKAKVIEAITEGVITCKENDDLEKAVKEMADKKIRRMVVTDDSDKLTGILSLDDVAGHARSEQLKNDILRGIAR
jgi:predicted transcriptional regulator